MNEPAGLSTPGAPDRRARPRRVAGFGAVALLVAAVVSGQPAAQPQRPVPADLGAALQGAVESATTDAPPAPLRFSNRIITVLRATLVLRTPAVRATAAERLLGELADLGPATATSRPQSGGYIFSVGSRDVFAIIPADLDPAGSQTIDEAAAEVLSRLQVAIDEAEELRSPNRLAWGVGLTVLATVTLVLLLLLLNRGQRAAARYAADAAERQLGRLPGAEVMRASRVPEVFRYGVGVVSAAIGLFFLYSWLTFVLRRFPYTRPWGEALRGFLLDRLAAFAANVVAAFPDLFTIVLIVLFTRVVVKACRLLFEAVEDGRAAIPWLHPETAQPTRRIVTGLLWLFALALAYPYLPGSNTEAFRGVSVFVGLVISLGSSGIVNQVMSGLTLTYSRALRVGDFVRIGEVEGTVTYVGPLSTKLKTLRNEEITIPNAVVVAAQTTNYSRFSAEEGVFVATTVTIGYDVPWRQVQAMLLQAAQRTEGVRSEPAPIVRQVGLRDFYVEYTLFVCLEDPAKRPPTLDRLHGHIQDAFNEHGVQIMSPNYEADPSGPKIVPRDRWFTEPASPPADK